MTYPSMVQYSYDLRGAKVHESQFQEFKETDFK